MGDDERQAFYVVRKGDMVGIYRSLSDLQAQAGHPPSNHSIAVYKGYCLSKEAESYLASHGLKNPSFLMAASELPNGLFGSLAICPFQVWRDSRMGDEWQAFYVVWKGDVVGIYRSFSDCQDQAGYSQWNPSIMVYKGYCLSKEAESYLASHGLKNPSFSMAASELRDGLFGYLAVYPFQDASTSSSEPNLVYGGSCVRSANFQNRSLKLDNHVQPQVPRCFGSSCIIEFDGASRGNPGPAGAGAVVRNDDGSLVFLLREGVGIATNNVAEYRGVILGLRYALTGGFSHVHVRGDSQLVCKQIEGLWKTNNQNMADLCRVARELKEKFTSFRIEHIGREFNAEADAQANLAIDLWDGQVEVDFGDYGMRR
ncbi:hypothetical protein Dimus_039196 [Dionaea muscipula]